MSWLVVGGGGVKSFSCRVGWLDLDGVSRGQTDRGYKKPVTNTDNEIAIPLGMKWIPDD